MTAQFCRFVQQTIAAVILVLVAACGSSTPPESDGQKAIDMLFQSNGKGLIRLSGFKKTDGQSAEINGVKLYIMEWSGSIEAANADTLFNLKTFNAEPMTSGFVEPTTLRKGFPREASGKIMFERTERGWRTTSAEITNLEPDKEEAAKLKAEESATKAKKAESAIAEKGALTQAEVKQAIADGVKPITALFWAVSSNSIDAASYCLENGADPNGKNDRVPLIVSARSPEMLELLRAKGADFNVTTAGGMTYLHQYEIRGKPELLEFVLSRKLVAYKKNDQGQTPLKFYRERAEWIPNALSKAQNVYQREALEKDLKSANQAIAILVKAGYSE